MIAESPFLQKVIAEKLQDVIIAVLKDRFKAVPRDIVKLLRKTLDEKKLTKLSVLAGKCADIESFRQAVGA